MFRYLKEESLRNKMGFNNEGADAILNNILACQNRPVPVGVNLGKNKTTTKEKAADDYLELYKKFHGAADYLVLNVSSPNTPGLRDLQVSSELEIIFEALASERKLHPKPLYLKISPDLASTQVREITELSKKFELAGIIATNTTIMPELGDGGISGKLLHEKSKVVRKQVLDELRETPGMQVIGVGGFSHFDEIWDFFKDGGRVIQIYTAFIYQGPQILTSFKNELDQVIDKNGHKCLEELLDNIKCAKR